MQSNKPFWKMLLFKDPYLDLIHQYIETDRCVIVPFSTDGIVDIKDLNKEFNKANKNLWITSALRDMEDESEFVKMKIISMGNNEIFENFIIQKESWELIGCIWLNTPEEESVRIVLWIRDSEEGKWYGTEVYEAMLNWARTNTAYTFLIHTVHKENERSGRLALKYGGILQKRKTDEWYLVFHVPL